jgi:hypothetical protein
MRRGLLPAVVALVAATSGQAAEIDTTIADFLDAPGFARADWERINAQLAENWLRTDLVSPGGNVGPVEQAVLLADAENAADRTRTAIAYGEVIVDDNGAPSTYSFVELRRYNLGPAIREALIAELGADAVDDAEAFGEGPHEAWRLVFAPVMGNVAALLEASHRIIPEDEAAGADCTGRPCLDVFVTLDDLAAWEDAGLDEVTWQPHFAASAEGIVTEAHAIAELEVAQRVAGVEGEQYLWSGGEHPEAIADETPFRFYAIDRNLGQELAVDAVSINTRLNDDSIRDMMIRRIEVAGDVYWLSASVGY